MGSDAVKVLSEHDFKEAISGAKPVLIDFWADWCGPCHMMAPVIEGLAEKYSDRMVFAKLNIDENPRVADMYMVHSIPTFIVFKGGKEVDRVIGAIGREAMEGFVKRHLP